nr:hypothetical protein [uncultured Sediminibacterium sp.]
MNITKSGLLIMAIFCAFMAQAQVNQPDSIARERIKLVQNNMYVLGAWAGANIIQGTISASNTHGSEHFLHQMNAYWNTVNLAIAGVGLLGIRKQLKQQYNRESNLKAQYRLEKILLLNAGLDLAYISTGLYLKERGTRLNNDRNVGYGNSLLLQGGFLLIFDLIQYGQHHKNTKWLEKQGGNLELGLGSNGLALNYRF